MRLDAFDYDLPDDRIALRPAHPRDAARMLVVEPSGVLHDRQVLNLGEYLRAGDVLLFNDTKVIAARLSGTRERDGSLVRFEATLHRRLAAHRWSAFAKPGKRLKVGDRVRFGEQGDRACLLGALDATVAEKGDDGEITFAFDLAGPDLDRAIAERGVMPLPPYIAARRPEDEQDRIDYQTVYAREDGSVAAPTAGLHFTPELIESLRAKGVGVQFVTLHVGAGTFLPVKADELADHRMHAEYGEVSPQTAA
ncbi:MAG TPA: S-adenosylmethionine:tRNA ribosyltransferase-isomerase, partial [Caulobacteraceae bacterium]|nr:S-adenosylmethionine:tRNA ribosyltransferase-isomerase [Caulobacteraceae bacterium]